MPGNSIGQHFRITTFGESHSPFVGVVVEGVLGGLKLDLERIQVQLSRRRPGQSTITSPRQESDQLLVLSGLNSDGLTLGSPLCLAVANTDARSDDYKKFQQQFRPSHADYTYFSKYGLQANSGGGRASARETIGRVMGGMVAEQILESKGYKIECVAFVKSIHNISLSDDASKTFFEKGKREDVDKFLTRIPEGNLDSEATRLIEKTRNEGDSLGGIISCVLRGCPAGWGEPVFDKFEADLAKAMMSLPATKGFSIGQGFQAAHMKGSEHNDAILALEDKRIRTASNHAGGIQGGITNGNPIYFEVVFKAPSTIRKDQQSVDTSGQPVTLQAPATGRHDPCVLPRAVPIVESMALLVACDHALRNEVNLP